MVPREERLASREAVTRGNVAGSFTLNQELLHHAEGDAILYTLRGGTPSYTHENKRGDVVAKTDASGSLTYQAQYEAFGKQVATTGSTLDRQKSNSKDTDPTNLVDEGRRYRDLETGMFINRDPAGFVDGPNLYTYVIQNPWTQFDPEGLDAADTSPNESSKDWHHGIIKTGPTAKAAGAAGIDIHDKKWGTNLPKDAHQSASGGGVHSNSYINEKGQLVPKGTLENGQNRNWNNEWDEWTEDFEEKNGRPPNENDFEQQYGKMKGSDYYKKAYASGEPATNRYPGAPKQSATPGNTSAQQTEEDNENATPGASAKAPAPAVKGTSPTPPPAAPVPAEPEPSAPASAPPPKATTPAPAAASTGAPEVGPLTPEEAANIEKIKGAALIDEEETMEGD